MRQMYFAGVCAPFLVFALSSPALASGGHWFVDDATLTEAGRCELEAWVTRHGRDDDESVLLPACNFTGNLELSLGLNRIQERRQDRRTEVEVGAKTLFRDPEEGGYGWGLAGIAYYDNDAGKWGAFETYIPLTVGVTDRLTLHYNLGWEYQRDDRNAGLWGVAADMRVAPVLHWISEIASTHRGGTELQTGFRFEVDVLVFDVSYAWERSDTSENSVTVGFAATF